MAALDRYENAHTVQCQVVYKFTHFTLTEFTVVAEQLYCSRRTSISSQCPPLAAIITGVSP